MKTMNPTIIRALISVLAVFNATAQAADFFVSPAGNDANAGSLDAPLRTLEKAAAVAKAGDTVFLRAGTYYEVLRPASSGKSGAPIRFLAYNREEVTIHGGTVVANWTKHEGNVYAAKIAAPVSDVFVNRQGMSWARHPNLTYDARHGFDFYVNRFDTNNPPPAVNWDGAVLHRKQKEEGQWTFNAVRTNQFVHHPLGVLYGVKGLLDAEGEWVWADGTLFLYAPGGKDPNSLMVEARTRTYAIDLSDRSWIQIEGVTVFAGSINLNAADHCTIENCRNFYNCPFVLTEGFKGYGGFIRDKPTTINSLGLGLALGGSDNIVRNCEIACTWGDGVSVYGSRNRVENCHIHDTNWSMTDCAAISVAGSHHVIKGNRINRAGRSGLVFRNGIASSITHNDISDYGRNTTDLGGIYTYDMDGQNSEIAYNWVHDDNPHSPQHAGIYLDGNQRDDSKTRNFIVHHNVVWNVNWPAIFDKGAKMRYYNNTLVGRDLLGGATSNIYCNNLLVGTRMDVSPKSDRPNNLVLPKLKDARFVDPAASDYSLQADSPAVDRGQAVNGYTDGFKGKSPEVGAYEFGGVRWKPGPPDPLPSNPEK